MKFSRRSVLGVLVATVALVVAGCSGAGSLTGGGGREITVAMVSNSQMQDAVALSDQFEQQNPGVSVKFVTLSENEARAKITASVATGGGEFDVVMISNYETPMWGEYGWLVDLGPYMAADPDYDADDFIPTLKTALSHDGSMYSAPFYGESSFLMYNKRLFAEAGVSLPPNPTWPEVAEAAAKLDSDRVAGICLRGKPGWGEVLAPLNTVINAYGGRWYDEDWNARLDSPEVKAAVQFYVDTVRRYGEAGASSSGFQECGNLLSQGRVAMWYDATSAVSVLESPETSTIAGDVGYLPAPSMAKKDNGWLYTWSLGIPSSSEHPDEAWAFIRWMTGKEYIRYVAEKLGPSHVPPGSRMSTYELPAYRELAEPFAEQTLASMQAANQLEPTLRPVPYTGVQFLAIPEFQDLGTRVSQQISAAIAGQISVDDALAQAQEYAEVVGKSYQREH
ncbi:MULTISPECIES: ABC transporter substrate-binding protein [Gordonia]|uniref:Probable ABC transporter-binding protein DR_1438 n=1 Tax=Gordonia paraffinivorans TaxID=175628 RepID=A0ABD7V426_9ACTN|nr:sugar ABC transporter substrate-binding protein [Gordonia paraffinivorans]MBY4572737.1 sugar ABC transporter substrate-binding protein [Gordonia paraffinivorans]PWD43731.1 sugar ABC transporter substrate-binding protein [Gordonia paraffinivorans]VFA89103.1 Probable ABC transporter-binding protein DR_1438 precursor [Gordonia paraffinivorans]